MRRNFRLIFVFIQKAMLYRLQILLLYLVKHYQPKLSPLKLLYIRNNRLSSFIPTLSERYYCLKAIVLLKPFGFSVILFATKTRQANTTRRKPNITAKQQNSPLANKTERLPYGKSLYSSLFMILLSLFIVLAFGSDRCPKRNSNPILSYLV